MLTADINMQLSTTVLASIVFFATCCLQPAKAACNNDAPDYVAVDCRIAATNDTTCHSHRRPDGSVLDICNERTSCLVWTGMQLNISCGDEDMDSPFQNVYSTQGQGNFSWPFATKSAVQGVYTCIRNKDGAVISNRSVIVDERAQVIPGQPSSFRQYCVDISPQFECSIARTVYYVASASGTHTVSFNVLGARPVQVNVESLWADHHPVDSLSYNPEASNSTTLHVVEFVTENVFFVASESVDVYLVVTASNSYGSSTLCLPLTLIGEATLFPNKSLPEDLTVAEGQPAVFHCQAKTTRDHGLKATVAFLVHSPDSPEPMQCLNCSFSPSSLFSCTKTVDKGGCYGLRFLNSTSGQDFDKTHHLTAQWDQVGAGQNGSVVMCAIAVKGTIQWQNSATLSVTITAPTSTSVPTPTLESKKDTSDKDIDVVLIIIGAVVAVVAVIAFTVGLLVVIWCFNRPTQCVTDVKQWQKTSTEGDLELIIK